MATSSTRSPSAPSKSAEYCMDLALRLYRKYAHGAFDSSEIANLSKLSATSGPFRGLMADMKQYKLIEKVPDGRFAVSQFVKDYESRISSNSELNPLRYEVIEFPDFFRQLLAELGGKLPEEQALISRLMSQYRFNQNKAKAVARAFASSLIWAHAVDENKNIIKPRNGDLQNAQTAEEGEQPASLAKTLKQVRDASATNKRYVNSLTLEVPLKNGRLVHICYPADLMPNEARKVCRILEVLCEEASEQ